MGLIVVRLLVLAEVLVFLVELVAALVALLFVLREQLLFVVVELGYRRPLGIGLLLGDIEVPRLEVDGRFVDFKRVVAVLACVGVQVGAETTRELLELGVDRRLLVHRLRRQVGVESVVEGLVEVGIELGVEVRLADVSAGGLEQGVHFRVHAQIVRVRHKRIDALLQFDRIERGDLLGRRRARDYRGRRDLRVLKEGLLVEVDRGIVLDFHSDVDIPIRIDQDQVVVAVDVEHPIVGIWSHVQRHIPLVIDHAYTEVRELGVFTTPRGFTGLGERRTLAQDVFGHLTRAISEQQVLLVLLRLDDLLEVLVRHDDQFLDGVDAALEEFFRRDFLRRGVFRRAVFSWGVFEFRLVQHKDLVVVVGLYVLRGDVGVFELRVVQDDEFLLVVLGHRFVEENELVVIIADIAFVEHELFIIAEELAVVEFRRVVVVEDFVSSHADLLCPGSLMYRHETGRG